MRYIYSIVIFLLLVSCAKEVEPPNGISKEFYMSTKEVITMFEKALKNEVYLSDEDMKIIATYYKKHLSQHENAADGTEKELIQQMIFTTGLMIHKKFDYKDKEMIELTKEYLQEAKRMMNLK